MFPGYLRGVVLAHNVTNGSSPQEVVTLLREAEGSVRERVQLDKLTNHPHISAWREAYRRFGAKPSKYRSAVEGLTRRALRNQPLPSINTLVDIGNVISLRHLVPAGAHAIDVVTDDIELRLATGKETFVAFRSTVTEHPLPGEVIFVENNIVLTRRWTWRQAQHTLTLPSSQAILMNIDAFPPISYTQVEKMCEETVRLIERFCGGKLSYQVLSQDNRQMALV